MAYQYKIRSFLPQSSEVQSDGKPQTRDPPRRLKTIKEVDPTQSPKDTNPQPRQTADLSATSPYAASMKCQLSRSKSLTKARPKPSAAVRHASPEKERTPKLASFHTRAASMVMHPSRLISTPMRLHRLKKKHSDFSKSFDRSDDSLAPQLNLSFNNSFNTLIAAPEGHRTKDADLRSIFQLMLKKLKTLEEKGESDWRSELEICSKSLSDAVALGSVLGAFLDKIKSKYEGWILSFADQCTKSQSEVLALQDSLVKEIEEKKALKRKFEKISRENVELCRSYETYQNKCFEYQEKLTDIANVSLDEFPPSENAWRLLLSELDTYKSWKDSADREFRAIQSKERKLLELLHAIKKRGFPVEEVYNSDVKKPKPQSQSQSSSRRGSDDLESQRFVTGPPAGFPRPDRVPALKMEKLEKPAYSESQSPSQPSTLHDGINGFILFQMESSSSTLPEAKLDKPQKQKGSSSQSQSSGQSLKSNDCAKA